MTPDLDEIARLVWAQLWQVTVVALAIGAAVKRGCRKRPRLAYVLWMLVIVKSIVPPVWESPTGLFSWVRVSRLTSRPVATENPPTRWAAPPVAAPLSGDLIGLPSGFNDGTSRDRRRDGTRFHCFLALLSVWATGAVLCTAFVLWKQMACSILLWRSRLPGDERYAEALTQLSRRLGVKRRVRLILTSRPIGPAVFGLFRPSILLPEPLLSGQPLEQVQLVLAHELIHVRRGDIFAGKLQLVAQLVWWFHPLVWWVNREACRERERCCDEEVVSGVGCKPVLYARTLLSVLERKGQLRSLVAIPGVRALEVTSRRLESIMKYAETDHRRAYRISRLVFAAGTFLLVPGAGLTLRADPQASTKPKAAITDVAAESPNARPVDDGSAKSELAAQGDGAKTQASHKTPKSESAQQRLGEWVGMGILNRPKKLVLRKELGLTEDQVEKVTKLQELRSAKLMEGIRVPLNRESPGTGATAFDQFITLVDRETGATAFEQLFASANQEAGKALVDILTTIQCQRLEQIILTSHGVKAFSYPDVRKDLRLTPRQEAEIDGVIHGVFARLRELQYGLSWHPKDYEGVMGLKGRIAPFLWNDAFNKVLALLTREQSMQWKAMIGVPFRAEEAESGPTPTAR